MTEAGTEDTLAAATSAAEITLSRGREAELARGDVVGRYVVLSKLGAGGMGVVYAAYDPELDRKVALKLLHAGADEGTAGATRLLREAQALAKLSHPHIVAVHDTGTVGTRVWIAMEFVSGRTLGKWLEERPRSWREVLACVIEAGRGLAAAHASGLVHRDFKPDNVMVGEDGRVRVMDFGLARSVGIASGASEPAVEDAPARGRRALDELLTRPGALAGTPAYMAPEQFAGEVADARTDQFALCVTLWEGLYGERPFRGKTLAELAADVLDGIPRAPPRRAGAPAWLRRIVLRGLARRPSDRWPTTVALLDALARGRQRARMRRAFVGVGALAVALAGVAGANALDRRARLAACEDAGASIAEVWNDERRDAVRAGILATGVAYAETTARNTTPWMDEYARAWQEARTASCLDAEIHGSWDAAIAEQSLWCLEERRLRLDGLAAELVDMNRVATQRAVTAAADLPEIATCRDASLLSRQPQPPSEHRDQVREIRAELTRAEAMAHAGSYASALDLVRDLLPRADELGWPPLAAAVRAAEASLLVRVGSFEEAARVGADAYYAAATAGAWDVAAGAAIRLVRTCGDRLARPAEGVAWGRHAEVALAHAGGETGLRRAALLHGVATIHINAGEHAEAREQLEEALAIFESMLGAEHPDVAGSAGSLANVHYFAGDYAKAIPLYERAVAIEERALGPDHPDVAMSLSNLAGAYNTAGDPERARSVHERALAIREHALGPDHPDVADSLSNLAGACHALGDDERAMSLFERALAIREHALGPEHPAVAMSLSNLGILHRRAGNPERARANYERALAIYERAYGREHADIAMTLTNLAIVVAVSGDQARARQLNERALAIKEKLLGPDHPDVAYNLLNLAGGWEESGEPARAVPLLERALAIREKALGPDHLQTADVLWRIAGLRVDAGSAAAALPLAQRAVTILDGLEGEQPEEPAARFVLARALLATGGDREAALAQAELARASYVRTGEPKRRQLEAVDAWLKTAGASRR